MDGDHGGGAGTELCEVGCCEQVDAMHVAGAKMAGAVAVGESGESVCCAWEDESSWGVVREPGVPVGLVGREGSKYVGVSRGEVGEVSEDLRDHGEGGV